jgi:hypothetical protein
MEFRVSLLDRILRALGVDDDLLPTPDRIIMPKRLISADDYKALRLAVEKDLRDRGKL